MHPQGHPGVSTAPRGHLGVSTAPQGHPGVSTAHRGHAGVSGAAERGSVRRSFPLDLDTAAEAVGGPGMAEQGAGIREPQETGVGEPRGLELGRYRELELAGT